MFSQRLYVHFVATLLVCGMSLTTQAQAVVATIGAAGHREIRSPSRMRSSKPTLNPQPVRFTVFARTGTSPDANTALRVPILITPDNGGTAIKTHAVGLPTAELASLIIDTALLPGIYRVSSDLAPPLHNTWKFKIHADRKSTRLNSSHRL